MSLQRVPHRLLALLLALVIIASGLLSYFGAARHASDQNDLRTDTVLTAASTPEIRAPLAAADPTDDPALAPAIPDTVTAGDVDPISLQPFALIAASFSTIPPSRGPPAAAL
jgi:hypothetical protein